MHFQKPRKHWQDLKQIRINDKSQPAINILVLQTNFQTKDPSRAMTSTSI